MSVDAKGNGVWVAKDLWRNMRHQLDQKATDYVHIQDEHNRIVSQLTEEITQLKDYSLALKQANALLDHQGQEEGRAHAATVQTLNAELEALRLQLSASKHEHRQQVDSLMRMLSERDRAAETASSLSRSLDDTAFQLKLEAHRASISDERIEALEKELAFYKERVALAEEKIQVLEATEKDMSTQLKDGELQLESCKERMLAEQVPDSVLEARCERLENDNKRLVALLEGTEEYKKFRAQDRLSHKHFVSLAETLADSDQVSQTYNPNRNLKQRLHFDTEAYRWVPQRAVEITEDFVNIQNPKISLKPLMALLLDLNRVWLDNEKDVVAKLTTKHEERESALKRRIANTVPYEASVQRDKIRYLQDKLRKSLQKVSKLARFKNIAAKEGEEGARLLLEWSLATIENLSSQVQEGAKENLALKRSLTGGGGKKGGGSPTPTKGRPQSSPGRVRPGAANKGGAAKRVAKALLR